MRVIRIAIYLLMTCAIINCSPENKSSENQKEAVREDDPVIVVRSQSSDLGANLNQKAIYQLKGKQEQGDLSVTANEYKQDSSTSIVIRFSKRETYQNQHESLPEILAEISKNYNLERLKFITVGRLYNTGDLAVSITNQLLADPDFKDKILKNEKFIITQDYKVASEYLMDTKIAIDFNQLLEPYSLMVSGFTLEKVGMFPSEHMINDITLDTDSVDIPERILDAQVWVNVNSSN